MQNRDFWSRITSLCGSQTSPVVLCVQNSVMRLRLYVSQPSSVVFACKTAWLASESLVSMVPSPHVWFLDAKQWLFDPNNRSLWVPDVTCRFVHAIQRDQHLHYWSLWVPAVICGFCMQNSNFWTRVPVSMGTRPHMSFCACKTAWFAPEWQVYIGSNPHLCFCACKTAPLGTDLQVCMCPSPNLYFEHT